MQRTNLVWDQYMKYLTTAILNDTTFRNAGDRPMMLLRTDSESDISSRLTHLLESADVAKEITKELGLNDEFMYNSMLVHDIGHTVNAHEVEVILNRISELFNIQAFHHNANGVDVAQSTDLCGKAISMIPNIEQMPELKKQLEDEFYYFLDVIISHDGEANKQDMMRPETKYDSLEEAVKTKQRLANSSNKYKFVAQTPEGKIAKFADVIAYMASDLRDRIWCWNNT